MGNKHKDCSFPVSENSKKDPFFTAYFFPPLERCVCVGGEWFILDIDSGLLYYPLASKYFLSERLLWNIPDR